MSGGTQNRRSPSGALTDKILEQFAGMNAVPNGIAAINYVAIGSPGDESVESSAQITVPEQGLLLALAIENFVPGNNAADAVTYRARKNGATIIRPDGTPAEATLSNTAPLAIIQINVDIQGALILPGPPLTFQAADLLSIQLETALAFVGSSPKVRVTLIWTPGRVEQFVAP